MKDENTSTEIEIVKAIAGAMQRLDHADNYGILVLLLVFSF